MLTHVNLSESPLDLLELHNGQDCLLDGEVFTVEWRGKNKDFVYLTKRDTSVPTEENAWYAYIHVRNEDMAAFLPVEEMLDILRQGNYTIS